MAHTDQDTPSRGEFAEQLIRQLLADLGGILSQADSNPADNAFRLVADAAVAGAPRGASLVVLLQGAAGAYQQLVGAGTGEAEIPAAGQLDNEMRILLPAAVDKLDILGRHAARLSRYAGETEPAAPPLAKALAQAIRQLYEGLSSEDHRLSSIGLVALRTLLVHIDAIASQLDPAATEDRPVRVFAPDRFHDYFMKLTELVQSAKPGESDRPVAALTKDGRLTAVITEADHPLEASAQAIRDLVPGDAATKEHALFRMQGLLRAIDELRADGDHPWAGALKDQGQYLGLVTAAATAPMAVPGRFSWAPLGQVARHNLALMQSGAIGGTH